MIKHLFVWLVILAMIFGSAIALHQFLPDLTSPVTGLNVTQYYDTRGGGSVYGSGSGSGSGTGPTDSDLEISKADSPDPVLVGEDLTYTITVTNNGSANATGVNVTDTLPLGTTFQSATPSTGSANQIALGVVDWNIGNLNSGASASLTIQVTAPSLSGNITNTAIVSGNETDSNLANNTATEKTIVSGSGTGPTGIGPTGTGPTDSDLEISKSDSPDPVFVGEDLTYTITVTNNGSANATGVNVTDTLPLGTTFQSATPSTGSANQTAPGVVEWNIGNLNSGASASLTIQVTAPSLSGNITNTASVSGNETDSNPGNNTATEKTIVSGSGTGPTGTGPTGTSPTGTSPTGTDLEISTVGSPDPVIASANLTYTITVTNNGSANATGVNVLDILSENVTFISANTSTGSANQTIPQWFIDLLTQLGANITQLQALPIVWWDIGDLAKSASANLTIQVTAPSLSDNITNTASVSSNEPDSNLANNIATIETTVSSANFAMASSGTVNVIAVPWQGDINKYHTTWDGHNAILKGVIKTDNTTQIWYKWIFGDGSESSVTPLSGSTKYNVDIQHAYTGAVGTPFTAQLLVDDVDNTMSHAVADNYLVKIEENNLDSQINIAIDNGLWYLYRSGSNASSNYHTLDGSPYMVWSYSSYYASPTASTIHAFQINGHKETGDFNEDPYAEYVELGFNWLFNGYFFNSSYPMLRPLNIGVQTGGDPDSRPNGIGIEVRDYGYMPAYQGGMVMDAIIASGTPGADSGRDFDGDGNNETYQEVLQDMVDMYAWGQYDGAVGGNIIGGWRYNWNQWPDNSACQWAAIGMSPAEEPPWNCTVPQWVKTYNDNWLDYSFYQWNWDGTQYLWGGFGYTSPSWGDALTPSGMVQLDFVGTDTSDPRWVKTERWFADGWKDRERDWLDRKIVYAYYSFAKAMRLALPNPVVNFSEGYYAGLDWYRGGGGTMGLAEKLCTMQYSAGNWNYYGNILGTSWSVIILKPVLFAEAPVACFDADPNPSYPDQPISFDPSCSGHSEAGKDINNIVLFEWDWDNDGIYDHSTTTPDTVTHSFSCGSVPCYYPVTLKVTDDSNPIRTATYVMTINITNPPHPPVARAKDVYMVSLCESDNLTLDGSDSYDPDEGSHEAGCTTCPDDTITAYEWDLTRAPWDYTDASGEVITNAESYFGTAGIYDIGLRVTDNTEAAYPNSGSPNLTDEDFAVVEVYDDGGICDVDALPLCQAVSLSWADIGADMYYIYRSFSGPNHGFQDIGRTTGTSKIAGSFVMEMPHWYRIMAEKSGQRFLSKAVMVIGSEELCDPTADAGGPYVSQPSGNITLDGSGSTALVGTIVAWDWDLDNDGEYDDAFGETVLWTHGLPLGTYPIGLRVRSSDSLELMDTDTATLTILEDYEEPTEEPLEVGGYVAPISKIALLAPWIALAAIIIAGVTLVVRRGRVI